MSNSQIWEIATLNMLGLVSFGDEVAAHRQPRQ